MNSYAEIIYLTAAMMIFSLLVVNTGKTFNNSRSSIYRAEAEYRAIAVAQDELDKVQWIYDDTELDPASGDYVYSSYPVVENHVYGSSNQYSDSFTINSSSVLIADTGTQKRYQVTVKVVNSEVDPAIEVTLNYTKSYSY